MRHRLLLQLLAIACPHADPLSRRSGSKSGRAGYHAAMGIVISLILIAFGAILTWAVNTSGGSVNPQVVGVILMVIGIIVFVISLVLWRTWWGPGFWGAWGGPGYD